jgi:hypothetical protein
MAGMTLIFSLDTLCLTAQTFYNQTPNLDCSYSYFLRCRFFQFFFLSILKFNQNQISVCFLCRLASLEKMSPRCKKLGNETGNDNGNFSCGRWNNSWSDTVWSLETLKAKTCQRLNLNPSFNLICSIRSSNSDLW